MNYQYLFRDRTDAGRKLGKKLLERQFDSPVVFGLPRGGVVVAEEAAKALGVPLNIVIARKIGEPYNREFGIGALSEDLIPHWNEELRGMYDFQSSLVSEIVLEEQEELKRRVQLYRNGTPVPLLTGKTALVIDDGLATGVTAHAAGRFLRTRNPSRLILAVPVAPVDVSYSIRETYDEVISLHFLSNLMGVGLWYDNFDQVEDSEVLEIMRKYRAPEGPSISAN